MNRDDEDIEPLGAVEQALLDGWLKIKEPRGCHWIVDVGQYCNKPLAQPTGLDPGITMHSRLQRVACGCPDGQGRI